MEDFSELTDEEYYAELKMMFQQKGWRIFLAELMDNAKQINSVEDTSSIDELFYRKGQMAVLGNILNTESTIAQAEEEAAEDAEDS